MSELLISQMYYLAGRIKT